MLEAGLRIQDLCDLEESGSFFFNLVGSGLNIKVLNPSKIELFLQYLLTKLILQYQNIFYYNFYIERKM